MKVFLNPGHDRDYDSGAVNPNNGARECDVAYRIGKRVKGYLEAVGIQVRMLQSDNLDWDSRYDDRQDTCVCDEANNWPADIFVAIHCDAFNTEAHGTSSQIYAHGGRAEILGQYIHDQITKSLGTVKRGLVDRTGLIVLSHTDMPAALIETAFIDNDADCDLLLNKEDEFARAIARGITDYQQNQGL